MIRLPDPEEYEDPIRYFRDCHGVVGATIDRFERLVTQAKQSGVSSSFKAAAEWQEIFDFLAHVAPIHERDEERGLFPIVLEKVPHMGFQTPESPNRFIHEEHEVMQEHSRKLLSIWNSDTQKGALTAEEESRFFEVATELIRVYREHISMENTIIYTAANENLLSPAERIAIMLIVRELHSERTVMPVIGFGETIYNGAEEEGDATTEAFSEQEIESSEEEDDHDDDSEGNEERY